jgi:hypothetical protein
MAAGFQLETEFKIRRFRSPESLRGKITRIKRGLTQDWLRNFPLSDAN